MFAGNRYLPGGYRPHSSLNALQGVRAEVRLRSHRIDLRSSPAAVAQLCGEIKALAVWSCHRDYPLCGYQKQSKLVRNVEIT